MLKLPLITLLLLIFFTTQAQQRITNPNGIVDTFKKSIACIAKGKINGADAEINYYSPAVRNRIIWGGLVPFDNVWVTGAHNATNIIITKAFMLGNTSVKAGTYAIFTIPGKDEWIFILNKNYKQHLADNYKQEDDLLRIKVKPVLLDKPLERLQYFIENNQIIIAWEKLKIEIPVISK